MLFLRNNGFVQQSEFSGILRGTTLYSKKSLVFTHRALSMLINKIKNRKSGIALFGQKGFRRQYHPALPDLITR